MYSIIGCMIKVMHVDNVFEVFIFLILIFGYFFYARRGAYLIMFILLNTFSGASRHNASQKIFKIQDTMQYQHPINAGREEKKIYSANKLYHRDHIGLLILAIYIVCRLNQYKCFTNYPLFGSKSRSCCDPYC